MMRSMVLVAAAAMVLAGTGCAQDKAPERKMVIRSVQGQGQGQRAGQFMRQRGGAAWVQAADELKLSDSQKKEMQKLATQLQKKNIPIRSQIELARLEIREQFASEKPDRTQLEKYMKQVSDLEFQLKMNHLDHQIAVRGILDKDQLKKWHWQDGDQMQRRVRFLRQRDGNFQVEEFDEPMEIEENITIEEED